MNYRRPFVVSIAVLITACPGEVSRVDHIATLEQRPDIACIWDRLLTIAKHPRVQTIRDDTPVGLSYRFNLETNSAPQQSLFDVDAALDNQCNLVGLLENMQRTCDGKHCKQLAAADD